MKMPPPGVTTAIESAPKSGGRMPPPGADAPKEGAKASREEAQVVEADRHCIDCHNYDPTSGECAKVEGSFDPQSACVEFFEPMEGDGHDEPDADDLGGPLDGDADDQQ